MQLFIGLTGVKESGKTTTFNIIEQTYEGVVEVTLARRLKDVCAEVLGIERDAFDNQALKEKELRMPVCLTQEKLEALIKGFGCTPDFAKHVRPHIGVVLDSPRRVAQYVGTEVLRNVDDNIHCLGAVMNLPVDGIFVVTDMRFQNEFDFFKNRYPLFFPLYIANYAAESKVGPNSHASERYVLEIAKKCERIDNNGTLEELQRNVVGTVQDILNRVLGERDSSNVG